MNGRETKTPKRPSSGIRTLSQMYVYMCCFSLRASPLSNLPYQRCYLLIFFSLFLCSAVQNHPQRTTTRGSEQWPQLYHRVHQPSHLLTLVGITSHQGRGDDCARGVCAHLPRSGRASFWQWSRSGGKLYRSFG